MTTNSYWFVREHVGNGLYHLIEGGGASTTWQAQPRTQALCGQWIASEDGRYDSEYEADMIGEPTCHACFRRAE